MNSYNTPSPPTHTGPLFAPMINGNGASMNGNHRHRSPLAQNWRHFGPPRTILSPLKYSLSNLPPNDRSHSPRNLANRSTGPLLTSTESNLNLSTYIDSKSPGLSSRIVQYNNKAQENRVTHQAKYGSPGLFPIVHLHKREIPVISPSQKKVTVRISGPELPFTSPGLLEESPTHSHNFTSRNQKVETDLSTRSVLDALKEISRKRIQTEDLDFSQSSCKKLKISNKEETKIVTSTENETNPAFVIDAVRASLTSSDIKSLGASGDLKRKVPSPTVEAKKSKLVAQTTQTEPIVVNADKEVTEIDKKHDNKQSPVDKVVETAFSSPISQSTPKSTKFARDFALAEEMKKRKLSVLLKSLRKIDNVPEEKKEEEKAKPASILSPQNKPKHNKHVSFNLPESETKTIIADVTEKESTPTSVVAATPIGFNVVPNEQVAKEKLTPPTPAPSPEPQPETISNIAPTFPISTSSTGITTVSKPEEETAPKIGGFKFDLAKPAVTATPSLPAIATPVSKIGGFSFGSTSTTSSVQATSASLQIGASTPSLNFGSQMSTTNTVGTISSPKISSPSGNQGFSLTASQTLGNNFKTSISSSNLDENKISSTPNIQFGASMKPNSSDLKTSFPTVETSQSTKPTSIAFGTIPSTQLGTSSAPFQFGATTTPSFSTIKSPQFGTSTSAPSTTSTIQFGSSKLPQLPTNSNPLQFGNVASPQSTAATTLSFGTAKSTAPIQFGSSQPNQFAIPQTTQFGVTATTTTSTPVVSNQFNVTTTAGFTSNQFVTSSSNPLPGFTSPSTAKPSFSSPFGATPNLIQFNSPATTVASTNSQVSATGAQFGLAFGKPATTTPTTVAQFGQAASAGFGGFGASGSPAFGQSNTTKTFGNIAPPQFGAPVTTAPSNIFGATTTANASNTNIFGSNPTTTFAGFGSPTNTNAVTFGSGSNTNPAGFGSSGNAASFGPTANTASFGPTAKTASFGSNANTASFGPTANTASFGPTANTASFGSAAKTASFGSNATKSPGFGSSSSATAGSSSQPGFNKFGVSNTSAKATGPTASIFGSASGFPSSTNNVFGQKTETTFPATAKPAFGFGAPNTTAASTNFALVKSPSVGFGASGNLSNGTSGFGSPFNASTTATNSIFGATKPTASSTSFFSPPNTTAPPNFTVNSGAGDAFAKQPPAFGAASNSTTFGSPPPHAFGSASTQSGAFQFGAPDPSKPAVFAFGSSAKTEPAKTSGFQFSAGSAPAFGATAAPTFGSMNPNQAATFGSQPGVSSVPFNQNPTFGSFGQAGPAVPTPAFGAGFNSNTQTSGMFSIGAGSSNSKSRVQVKARRRT